MKKNKQQTGSTLDGTNNYVVTMAILANEHPRHEGSSDNNNEIHPQSSADIEKNLRLGHYAWFPVKRQYEGTKNVHIIYNISLGNALYLGGKYNQNKLVFIEGKHCEYWEQNGEGKLQKTHEREMHQHLNMTNVDDFFTQVSRSFNLQLPFFDGSDENKQQLVESIDDVNRTIKSHIPDVHEARRRIHTTLTATSGYNRYCNRAELYRNCFHWD